MSFYTGPSIRQLNIKLIISICLVVYTLGDDEKRLPESIPGDDVERLPEYMLGHFKVTPYTDF